MLHFYDPPGKHLRIILQSTHDIVGLYAVINSIDNRVLLKSWGRHRNLTELLQSEFL